MRIAVDAMGGDFAPAEIVKGACEAAAAFPDIEVLYLVGDREAVQRELDRQKQVPPAIQVVHSDEVIGMGEAPASAVRRKKKSSINLAVDLVKTGEAQAVFSAGNTGAAVAAGQLKLRTLEGVIRPGIATVFPSPTKPFVLIDAGATPDAIPESLMQFAIMGSVYSREILGVAQPKVGLMSIGEEDAKGNEVTKETFHLLQQAPIDFVGNIEGHDLFEGHVDVVVCDGFVGNVILKTSESVGHAIVTWIKHEFVRNPIRILGAILLRGALKSLKKKVNPESYGGAPLLGVKGTVLIGHGSSSHVAAFHGIRSARDAVKHHVNEAIVKAIATAQTSG
ncbi:MAG: phosphate acyltransferase PlsX [Verrucomicrobia bacterium]|nr:phosphate acyltransferase PlsX [Kiritimatiellia bacterium]MCB1101056.1 phosphate acyltransferase PlsX [Kiritimatiellia bacterium]MCP5489053.1 phosphate acyltransferase PlsX [Verrucomicrobiota bacterium]